MKIRVIVPCFNEGEVVTKTYDKLTEILMEDSLDKGYDYDLYLSTMVVKITIDHVQHLASLDQHVKYISFSRNFGKESAMIAGFQHSVKCDAVVMVDGDLQHPPEFIPQMIEGFQEGMTKLLLSEIEQVRT